MHAYMIYRPSNAFIAIFFFETKVKLSLISHQQIQITTKSLHRTTPLRCEPQAEQQSSDSTLINKKTPNWSYK